SSRSPSRRAQRTPSHQPSTGLRRPRGDGNREWVPGARKAGGGGTLGPATRRPGGSRTRLNLPGRGCVVGDMSIDVTERAEVRVVRSRDEEFVAFVQEVRPYLFRTAYLLCGDAYRAEDLVQGT